MDSFSAKQVITGWIRRIGNHFQLIGSLADGMSAQDRACEFMVRSRQDRRTAIEL
jgi:hypothetical protein